MTEEASKSRKIISVDDIILPPENLKYSKHYQQQVLEPINGFSKLVGHKINIEKLVAFLYNNSELSRKDIKKMM